MDDLVFSEAHEHEAVVLVTAIGASHRVVAADLGDHQVGVEGVDEGGHGVRDAGEALLGRRQHGGQSVAAPPAVQAVVRHLVDDVFGAMDELALGVAGR